MLNNTESMDSMTIHRIKMKKTCEYFLEKIDDMLLSGIEIDEARDLILKNEIKADYFLALRVKAIRKIDIDTVELFIELKSRLDYAVKYILNIRPKEEVKKRRIAKEIELQNQMKMFLNSSGIYEIVNIYNNKRYIGQAKNIKNRWAAHRDNFKMKTHHCKELQKDWYDYSKKAFRFNIIQILNKEQMKDSRFYERYWWENTAGEKYNDAHRIMSDKDFKIRLLEDEVKSLRSQLEGVR